MTKKGVAFSEAVDRLYYNMDRASTKLLGKKGRDVLIGSDQPTLASAVLADVVDVIPIIGDVGNMMRIRDAAGKGTAYAKKRLPLQVVDLAVGVLPDPIGGVLDMLTPTNTLTYLEKTGAAKWMHNPCRRKRR